MFCFYCFLSSTMPCRIVCNNLCQNRAKTYFQVCFFIKGFFVYSIRLLSDILSVDVFRCLISFFLGVYTPIYILPIYIIGVTDYISN